MSGIQASWMKINLFIVYLWGIEIRWTYKVYERSIRVYSLPMRNWNWSKIWWNDVGIRVYSLPMRNWNLTASTSCENIFLQFIVYLWGIEIRWTYKVYERSIRVYSLPMRNWNWSKIWWNDVGIRVYSLPMRNWNLTASTSCENIFLQFIVYLWGIEIEIYKISLILEVSL